MVQVHRPFPGLAILFNRTGLSSANPK